MENNCIVYYLANSNEPINIRYIGYTSKTLKHRLWHHLNTSKRLITHRDKWVNKSINDGHTILIIPIETNLSAEEAIKKEVYYIKKYRNEGYNLTNATDGGEGVVNPSLESRQKISEKNKGRQTRLGAVLSEETKEKIRQKRLGSKSSPETKKKISEAGKNRKHSEKTLNKMSEIQKTIQKGKKFPMHGTLKAIEINKKPVLQFDKNNNFIKEWDYVGGAALFYNIHKTAISSVCRGKSKTAAGFIWKYKE